MRTTLLSLVLPLVLAAVACGGNASPPPAEPPPPAPASTSTAANAQGAGGPGTPGDPSGIAPSNNPGATSLSGAPASPAEGKCKSGEAPATAADLTACLAGCESQDNTVPPGSKCIPARTSCRAQCNQKFKK